ncbi:13932_t:CDS:2 [Funneliformis mosseae]|uniref:13932_t:CDS:1 n=1 Tax=Funneliformis mosseae TaxID=27381 RepID=A0A9N8VU80_FUNMO|nr:13932_t:CDS:2 [Funneliformis mosseae]
MGRIISNIIIILNSKILKKFIAGPLPKNLEQKWKDTDMVMKYLYKSSIEEVVNELTNYHPNILRFYGISTREKFDQPITQIFIDFLISRRWNVTFLFKGK